MRDPAPKEAGPASAEASHGVGFAPIDAALVKKLPPPAQSVDFYKKHSLAARHWGAIAGSAEGLRQVSAEEAQETVLRGLLDTPLEKSGRSPREWVVAVAIHVAIISALVLIPLAFLEKLDSTDLQATYLTMPTPPAPPPPPPSAPEPVRKVAPHFHVNAITMPTAIPKKVVAYKDESAPDVGGVTGGVSGGEAGGQLGGVLGGIGAGPAPPPPPPAPAATKGIHRVGGDVRPPRQLVRIDPDYPTIARANRVEGVVVIDAVIDEQGDVTRARAISGSGLLIPAALKAVMRWKYEPTYLDGMPVSIEMEVEVGFHLRAAN